MPARSSWLIVLLNSSIPSWQIFLFVLLITKKGVLTSPAVIMDLFLLSDTSFCFS